MATKTKYKINKRYTAHKGNYGSGTNARKYIVVHNTGNTASALNEAKYAHNDQHASSYHYVLDGSGTIYRTLPPRRIAWAVGTAGFSGARRLIGNDESISIEVKSNGTKFTGAEIAELRWLVKRLMKRYGIPAKNVVRHYDCHTGRKDCPAYYCVKNKAGNFARWNALKKKITE